MIGNWIFGIFIALIFSRILYGLFQDYQRDRQVLDMAVRLKLRVIGTTLPGYVNLTGTPMAYGTKFWNVMEGTFNGVRVVVFDCRMGQGKHSWRRTVLAAESERDVFATVPSAFDSTVERSKGWTVFYSPKGFRGPLQRDLMPVDELEARLRTIG